MSASAVPEALVRKYLETEYGVSAGAPPFTLIVGQFSAALAQMHARHGVSCSTYITACNPFSRYMGDDVNAQRQLRLARDLELRGLVCFLGTGRHPADTWPGEPSFLVLGLELEEGRMLGAKYEQNAIVCCGPAAIPELVLLR